MAITESMTENRDALVPEGESTLSDVDLGMRMSSSILEGAPDGAVVVDTAEQKRLKQFNPVSFEEMLDEDQGNEYYCGSEDGVSNEEEGENEYDMNDGFIIPRQRRPPLPSSLSEEDSYEEEEEEEEEEEVFPHRGSRKRRRCEERGAGAGAVAMAGADEICPLCFYGNTEFDKIACEKAESMWKLLGSSFFSLSSTRMCSYVCYAQYYEEWYRPSLKRARKAGLSNHLPKWSADGMYKHITEHMGDPRIYMGITIERLRKLEALMNRFCFERNGEGQARPNLSVINQVRLMNKHIVDLYKTEPREMFGYCESWEANPKDMNRFVNLTRCKVTDAGSGGGTG